MIPQMGIVETEWTYLLLGLLAAWILLRRRELLRRSRCAVHGLSPRLGQEERLYRYRFSAMMITLTLLLIALLRPYAGYEDVEVRASGRDVLAIVDVSNSMLASDVSPSRLGLAKRKLLDLIRLLQEAGRQDRLGIVVFAGSSELFAPLTADYPVLKSFVNAISPDLVVQGGSDLEGALRGAGEVLEELGSEEPLVIVLSDGTEEQLSADVIERTYRAKNIPLVFLGVGTPEGARIELAPGLLVTDRSGRVVISKLNEEGLRAAAERSGGLYLRSRLDDGDLSRALQLIHELRGGKEIEASIRVYRELGPVLLKLILIGFILLAFVGNLRWVFPAMIGLLASSLMGGSPLAVAESAPSLHQAWQAYQDGDFEQAREGFASALESNPEDLRIMQALGSAEYKLEDFAAAAKSFDSLATRATTERERFEGLYNRGNAELSLGKYDDAIASYESALSLRPDDKQTQHNLQIAKDLKRQTPPPQQSSQSESSSSAASSQRSSSSETSNQESQDSAGSSDSASNNSSSHQGSKGAESSNGSQSQHSSAAQSEQNGESSGESSVSAEGQGSSEEDSSGEGGSTSSLEAAQHSSHDDSALKRQEAEAWLDSLPDAPMIPRRDGRRQVRQGASTW